MGGFFGLKRSGYIWQLTALQEWHEACSVVFPGVESRHTALPDGCCQQQMSVFNQEGFEISKQEMLLGRERGLAFSRLLALGRCVLCMCELINIGCRYNLDISIILRIDAFLWKDALGFIYQILISF